eukprot:gnl/TRDRNA2_/TRDRNA2_82665_c0_seq1.p1 gnl/TRDRNA2_/TRDRNA2_82665_c0~~gnl/TRDRNA2_/TRDRNA2_82665_c0_seq1.p1  ORF type:complete len:281 (-),score=68.81 gnl/TRDRNA2_/TRDRNA2_82665_c0_seq1:74-916(-)
MALQEKLNAHDQKQKEEKDNNFTSWVAKESTKAIEEAKKKHQEKLRAELEAKGVSRAQALAFQAEQAAKVGGVQDMMGMLSITGGHHKEENRAARRQEKADKKARSAFGDKERQIRAQNHLTRLLLIFMEGQRPDIREFSAAVDAARETRCNADLVWRGEQTLVKLEDSAIEEEEVRDMHRGGKDRERSKSAKPKRHRYRVHGVTSRGKAVFQNWMDAREAPLQTPVDYEYRQTEKDGYVRQEGEVLSVDEFQRLHRTYGLKKSEEEDDDSGPPDPSKKR